MTYRLIKRSNNYNRRGEEINVRTEVVETFDSLGIAIAHGRRLNDEFMKTWGRETTIMFHVEDLYGKRYRYGDEWELELVDAETFERLFEIKKDLAELDAVFGFKRAA